MSNLWLVNRVSLDYLTHDYLQAARENKYTFFHTTAIGMNKQKKILYDTTNFSGITEIYHELIETNNTILPQKFVNSNGIIPVKHQLVLVKTNTFFIE